MGQSQSACEYCAGRKSSSIHQTNCSIGNSSSFLLFVTVQNSSVYYADRCLTAIQPPVPHVSAAIQTELSINSEQIQ